jgi:hypothetical protein
MIEKKNVQVTMSLEDYESLDWFVKAYKELRYKVKQSAYIDYMTSEKIKIIINKDNIEKIVTEYLLDDCEFDGYSKEDFEFEWSRIS